ncbi:hypothetical protein FQA39_LY17765 [Lamprigera yunnana]|nr:hypothetical protein FQA39_LY17765 [Lamprigera yunnana]
MLSTLRGKHLYAQVREMAFNVYQWIKSQNENQSTKEIKQKISRATGVSIRTIERIIKKGSTSPEAETDKKFKSPEKKTKSHALVDISNNNDLIRIGRKLETSRAMIDDYDRPPRRKGNFLLEPNLTCLDVLNPTTTRGSLQSSGSTRWKLSYANALVDISNNNDLIRIGRKLETSRAMIDDYDRPPRRKGNFLLEPNLTCLDVLNPTTTRGSLQSSGSTRWKLSYASKLDASSPKLVVTSNTETRALPSTSST